MGKPYTKPALTFEQQLTQLESRSMVVNDRDRALRALSTISYYRLSAYWHPFKQTNNSFEPGTTFEQALELYEFDRKLRLVILDAIERVEVLARTLATYTLGHGYGAFAHTTASSFDPTFNHVDWDKELSKEIGRARENFLEHFRITYDGFPKVPIWMASEVMSLGTLSRMFKGMQTPDQQAISNNWSINKTVAASWLHTLSYIRNVCAHHGRLWNRELAIKPILPKHDPSWNSLNNRRIYATLCILRHLTASTHGGDEWAVRVQQLLPALATTPRWRTAMGMPLNWARHPIWNTATPAPLPQP